MPAFSLGTMGAFAVTTSTIQTIVASKTLQASAASATPLTVQGATGQTGNLLSFTDAAGAVTVGFNGAGVPFRGGNWIFNFDAAENAKFQSAAANKNAMVLAGAASQTANVLEVRNSGGTLFSAVDANGGYISHVGTPFSFKAVGQGLYQTGVMYAQASGMVFETPRTTESSTGPKVPFIVTSRGGIGAAGGFGWAADGTFYTRAAPGQTTPFQQWQASDGSSRLSVLTDGSLAYVTTTALLQSGYGATINSIPFVNGQHGAIFRSAVNSGAGYGVAVQSADGGLRSGLTFLGELHVNYQNSLGTNAGDRILISNLQATVSNGAMLQTYFRRTAAGTNWETTAIDLVRKIDATEQTRIEFYGGHIGMSATRMSELQLPPVGTTPATDATHGKLFAFGQQLRWKTYGGADIYIAG